MSAQTLTVAKACALGLILDAASRCAPVARMIDPDVDGGFIVFGQARCVVADRTGAMPDVRADVRDMFLHITSNMGLDHFWSIEDLIDEVQDGQFVLDYPPGAAAKAVKV